MTTPPFVTTLGPSAEIHYYPSYIDSTESAELINLWTQELDWIQSSINMFGKQVLIPRLNAWYGERGYGYSGTYFKPKPWTPELKHLKTRIEKTTGHSFNSVLINWYRDGRDSMGWHSDDEASLGINPQIASLSFGDSRKFVLREKSNKSNKHSLLLEDSSLLVMLGETQTLWQHAVPKTTRSLQSRINLTFRLIE